MSTTRDTTIDRVDPHNPPEGFSTHVEVPDVGGMRYWKCEHCGTESISWNPDNLTSECVHSDDCDNPYVGDSDE